MLTVPNQVLLDSADFNTLELLDEWFKYTWGDEHDPIPDNVVEYEEDYDLQEISQSGELSSTVM
jgi:hypothetical protein